jgi:hypothetical protein
MDIEDAIRFVIHQQEYAPHLPVGIQQITNTNANAKKSLNLENIA